MGIVVQKFGGTSVATAEKIHNAAGKVIAAKLAGNKVVVVVSAMGDTTDELIGLANQVCPIRPNGNLTSCWPPGNRSQSP